MSYLNYKDKEIDSWPLVSVCIPAFNCEAYLKDAILSVQGQEVDEIEILIVDDGSTDNTYQIATELAVSDGRIKVFKQTNSGSCVARNNAFSMASGKYICLLDSDDIWPSYKLKRQLEILEDYPDSIVIGGVQRFTDSSKRKWDDPTLPFKCNDKDDYLKKLLTIPDREKMLINTLCCRAEYLKNDSWDPRFRTGHDWEAWVRLASKYTIIHVNEVFQYYRKHQNSTTKNNKLRLAADCQLEVLNTHGPKIIKDRNELDRIRSDLLLSFANHAVYGKSRVDAFYLLNKSLKYRAWLNSRRFYRLLLLSVLIPYRPRFL